MAEDAARLRDLPFPRAAEVWLEIHRAYIEPRTYTDYLQRFRRTKEFFGETLLTKIHIGHFREYQKWRKIPRTYEFKNGDTVQLRHTEGAGNELINKELKDVELILKEAGLWWPIGERYRRLPVDDEGAGKSFTPEEKQRLLLACEAGIAANSTNRSQVGCH